MKTPQSSKRIISAVLVTGALIAYAPPAAAQSLEDCAYDIAPCLPYTGLAGIVTTTLGVAMLVGYIRRGQSYVEPYLRENLVAFRFDAVVGAGPTIRDLAALYEVSPRELGEALRSRIRPMLRLAAVGQTVALAEMITTEVRGIPGSGPARDSAGAR